MSSIRKHAPDTKEIAVATRLESLLCALAAVLALSLFSPLSCAENGATPHNDPFPNGLQGNVAHGQSIFAEHCVRCHGPRGDGKGPDAITQSLQPLSFQTASFRAEFGRRDIFTGTALGKLGTHMPTWLKNMDDQDVADVSEYVYQRFVLRQIDVPR
jgi:mono/diheme cytochrome c family protein